MADDRRALEDCFFFINSKCTKPACDFRHPALATLSTSVCKSWSSNSCRNLDCKFRHPSAPSASSVPCLFFAKGQCSKGNSCPYAHAQPSHSSTPAPTFQPTASPSSAPTPELLHKDAAPPTKPAKQSTNEEPHAGHNKITETKKTNNIEAKRTSNKANASIDAPTKNTSTRAADRKRRADVEPDATSHGVKSEDKKIRHTNGDTNGNATSVSHGQDTKGFEKKNFGIKSFDQIMKERTAEPASSSSSVHAPSVSPPAPSTSASITPTAAPISIRSFTSASSPASLTPTTASPALLASSSPVVRLPHVAAPTSPTEGTERRRLNLRKSDTVSPLTLTSSLSPAPTALASLDLPLASTSVQPAQIASATPNKSTIRITRSSPALSASGISPSPNTSSSVAPTPPSPKTSKHTASAPRPSVSATKPATTASTIAPTIAASTPAKTDLDKELEELGVNLDDINYPLEYDQNIDQEVEELLNSSV